MNVRFSRLSFRFFSHIKCFKGYFLHFDQIQCFLMFWPLWRLARLLAGYLYFRPFFSQRNCKNTVLNYQYIEFGWPQKARKYTRKNLPREPTNFYVQDYRDITLTTNLGKKDITWKKVRETLILSHLRPKMTYFDHFW